MDIDKTKPVLVTGGSGYIASWIIKMLLEDGMAVNTTLRDPSDEEKMKLLTALSNQFPGKLKLFKANLLNPGDFDEAIDNCELVIHTASPFLLSHIKNP